MMAQRSKSARRPMQKVEAILIGGSAGSSDQLVMLLQALPEKFPIPLIVACHLHPDDEGRFAAFLDSALSMPVSEAIDKQVIEAPHVTVAPGNYHLLVERAGTLALSIDPKVNFARPSIDLLFESGARAWAEKVVCVILSGANQDGAEGASLISSLGGTVVVQDPSTAEHPSMPAAAIALVPDALIMRPSEIGRFLQNLAPRTSRRRKAPTP